MIYSLGSRQVEFKGEDYFIADNATVIGSVVLGNNVSVWFNAVVRGDNDWLTADPQIQTGILIFRPTPGPGQILLVLVRQTVSILRRTLKWVL